MPNLSVDAQLLNDALKISGLKTGKDTVDLALRELINKRRASEILEFFGTIEYDEDYDYKEKRQRGA